MSDVEVIAKAMRAKYAELTNDDIGMTPFEVAPSRKYWLACAQVAIDALTAAEPVPAGADGAAALVDDLVNQIRFGAHGREALAAALERLSRERDQAISRYNGLTAVFDERDNLLAENAKLREAGAVFLRATKPLLDDTKVWAAFNAALGGTDDK